MVEGEDVEIQNGQDGQVYILEHRGDFNIGLREMVRGLVLEPSPRRPYDFLVTRWTKDVMKGGSSPRFRA